MKLEVVSRISDFMHEDWESSLTQAKRLKHGEVERGLTVTELVETKQKLYIKVAEFVKMGINHNKSNYMDSSDGYILWMWIKDYGWVWEWSGREYLKKLVGYSGGGGGGCGGLL